VSVEAAEADCLADACGSVRLQLTVSDLVTVWLTVACVFYYHCYSFYIYSFWLLLFREALSGSILCLVPLHYSDIPHYRWRCWEEYGDAISYIYSCLYLPFYKLHCLILICCIHGAIIWWCLQWFSLFVHWYLRGMVWLFTGILSVISTSPWPAVANPRESILKHEKMPSDKM